MKYEMWNKKYEMWNMNIKCEAINKSLEDAFLCYRLILNKNRLKKGGL